MLQSPEGSDRCIDFTMTCLYVFLRLSSSLETKKKNLSFLTGKRL